MDLSKKLIEKLSNKLAESPLDLSQKNVTIDVGADTKPCHLFGLRHLTPTCHSSIPVAQSMQQQRMQSSFVVNPLSALPANTLQSVPSALMVQKVSPVWPQTYSCTSGKQTDCSGRNCVSAAGQKSNGVQSFSARGSQRSDLVKSVHSGGRIVSIVKPSSSVRDTHIQYDTLVVEPDHSMHRLLPSQPIHTNPTVSPRCGMVPAVSFDAGRADRGVPLAQVYPSRVVMSTVQNAAEETVPSPVHCKKEPLRSSPPDRTQQLHSTCSDVCLTSVSSISTTSSRVDADAALPVLTSPANRSTDKSLVSVPVTSTDVSPEMPILSPNVSGSRSVSHVASSTAVLPESCTAKLTSSKGILPSVETSPMSYSDRDSIPDEYDSGHELFSTHMEWTDDTVSDKTDCLPDACNMEESSVKRPAFEVVSDCNRTLVSDISQRCYAVVAFDRSLLQNKSVDRNFILRTKYYRFFSRKACAAGSDSDAVLSDKCSLPNVTCSASQELRLPVPLSSALKGSSSSKFKSKSCCAIPTADVQQLDDIKGKCSVTTESNCKYGVSDKKVRGLRYQKPSATYDVVGDIYSPTLNNRPKGGDRIVRSDSFVRVKSEFTEVAAGAESKPDVLKRTVCRTRRKRIPTEVPASTSSSYDEFVGTADESFNSCDSGRDRDSRRSAKTIGSGRTERAASNLVDAHSQSVPAVRSKVSDGCHKVDCRQDLTAELSVVSGTARMSAQDKVPDVRQHKPGDANNNQGKTVDGLAASTSVRSARLVESEHLSRLRHTRSNTGSSKSDAASTYRLGKMTSSVSEQRQMHSEAKSKASRHSTDSAASLLPSTSDKTSPEKTCTASKTNGQQLHCTTADVPAEVSKSDSSSTVTDGHGKSQSMILKQLESSEGYIAEKNARYSKSEDLFDDSSLLSREQRALRVSSSILQLKIDVVGK